MTISPPAASAFREEFEAFAAQEKSGAIPDRSILFYGSSSIRLWQTLKHDFAGWPVVNRGFGGSTLADCIASFDRLVVPLRPRALVLYAGDNDLDHGASPEQVLARFEQFAGLMRTHLAGTPFLFVSIKPSPIRFWNSRNIERANDLIEEAIAVRWPEATFLDLYSWMIQPRGVPSPEHFTEDGLHMSAAGYALWTIAIGAALAELELR